MEEEKNYAGFWIRFAAAILDAIVLGMILYLVRAFISGGVSESADIRKIFESVEDFPQLIDALAVTIRPLVMEILLTAIISMAYWVLLTARFGATLGKMAMGIKVVGDDLNPVTYGAAFVREVLIKYFLYTLIYCVAFFSSFWLLLSYKNPFFIFLLFAGVLGYLWVIWDPKKQAWHDKIAHTLVIKDRNSARPVQVEKSV